MAASCSLLRSIFSVYSSCCLGAGSVYLNMRNNHRTKCHCRAYATSKDGAGHFGELAYDDALISPVCQATLSTGVPRDRLLDLFSYPMAPYYNYAGPGALPFASIDRRRLSVQRCVCVCVCVCVDASGWTPSVCKPSGRWPGVR